MPDATPDTDPKPSQTVGNKKKPRRINSLYLLLALLAGIYLINMRAEVPGVACTDERIAAKPEVIMLSTVWCPYCASARRYFHHNQIDYCEYDIERTSEGKRMYDDLGGGGIPILVIGDKYRINGFDERSIELALQRIRQTEQ